MVSEKRTVIKFTLGSMNQRVNNLEQIKNNLISYNWNLNSVNVNSIYDEIINNCDIVINDVSPIQLCISKFKEDVDNDKYVIAVFLDLKRAFETIDRNILLAKLKQYGIEGRVYNWLAEYLTERKQRVRIKDSISGEIPNNVGVPQGNSFVDCEFVNLFADDTLLACSDVNLNQAIQKMNIILSNVEDYLTINKLKLNVTKTKGMVITTKYKYNNINIHNINISIYNEEIEIVTTVKYLGFQLNNVLSFDNHFEYIYKKISKKLILFCRLANNLSFASRITVYQSIIQPHFDYCASLLYQFNFQTNYHNCKSSKIVA
ncbi:hypothetical protein NQ317_003315 [Molorchus minor]|uniref:Reverse transcriptase domain-containing protein n=1 Tax=Molorchus minor TaxID=1323400 RepID=A0ABQ9IT20_9CUCU|nr:hypothetical protein NQ317_003315 [Molorchus minor]